MNGNLAQRSQSCLSMDDSHNAHLTGHEGVKVVFSETEDAAVIAYALE